MKKTPVTNLKVYHDLSSPLLPSWAFVTLFGPQDILINTKKKSLFLLLRLLFQNRQLGSRQFGNQLVFLRQRFQYILQKPKSIEDEISYCDQDKKKKNRHLLYS